MSYQVTTVMPSMVSFVLLILLSSSSALITPSHPTNKRHITSLAATSPLFTLSANQKKPQQQSSPSTMTFAIPSIFNSSDSRPVILFDGQCNLCNAGVQLVLDNDRSNLDPRGNLRVAALQSRVGKILLSRLPHHQRDSVLSMSVDKNGQYKSIVVTSPHQTWLNSNACIYIGKQLKGPLRYLAYLASFVPAFIRDPMYKLLSRYRKKLFGESPECRLWDDNWDTRFIDDSLFGGRSEADDADDPFADPSKKVMSQEEDDDDIDIMDAPLSHKEGDVVRVISNGTPIVHTHIEGYEDTGLCSVGLVGKVSRVLNPRAYPKNVAVKFSLNGAEGGSFEAHFYPGQLKKE